MKFNFIVMLMFFSLLFIPLGCTSTSMPSDATDEDKRTSIKSMYAGYKTSFDTVEDITAKELKALLDKGEAPIIIDVREPEEQAVSRIPGAKTIEEFEQFRRTARFTKDTLIVTHCTIGYRSGNYAKELNGSGIGNVRNLAGSLLSWTHVGGALVDSNGEPTKRVHTYGEQWNLVAEGYEGVH